MVERILSSPPLPPARDEIGRRGTPQQPEASDATDAYLMIPCLHFSAPLPPFFPCHRESRARTSKYSPGSNKPDPPNPPKMNMQRREGAAFLSHFASSLPIGLYLL